jgi:hypothetical protein
LQLSHNFFVNSYFESHIADGDLVCEAAFNLDNPETFLLVLESEGFDPINGEDNVHDTDEYALASKHIANLESDVILAANKLVDFASVLAFFEIDGFFNSASVCGCLTALIFADEHFLFDSYHGLLARFVRVEFQPRNNLY